MLIPVNISNDVIECDDDVAKRLNELTFKELALQESAVEDFLRKNVGVIFEEEEENLLIVGQQVSNTAGGRSDLVAIDGDGSIVLIEIKRDVEDVKSRGRKEPFEFQAIRYAASFATIKTPEELINNFFLDYIENKKNKGECEFEELTTKEYAKRELDKFLTNNKAINTFNQKQRIILIASSFDEQTMSAVAWLISNGVDISCFDLTPMESNGQKYLKIEKILPLPQLEDFYIGIYEKKSLSKPEQLGERTKKTILPKTPILFEWGILKKGDKLLIKGYENSEAEVLDGKQVIYNGKNLTYNQWGKAVTGWTSICIYEWAIQKESNKTLNELRNEKLEQKEKDYLDDNG